MTSLGSSGPRWPPSPHPAAPADAMKWHCVEWMVQQGDGAPAGTTDVWVDGQELSGLHLTNLNVADLEQTLYRHP